MSFEYVELTDKKYASDCVKIHKKIFNLSDADSYPTSFFNVLIRKEHPIGMIIGILNNEDNQTKLVGIFVMVTDRIEKSLYCIMVCILPEYQNGRHGYMFAKTFKDIAIKKGYNTLFGIYNPFEANLGKLYSYIGGISTRYINDVYSIDNNDECVDKVLFEWQLNSEYTIKKFSRELNTSFQEMIKKYSIIQDLEMNEPEFLLEIPNNYVELKKTNSIEFNKQTDFIKSALIEYLNNRGYHISECLSGNYNSIKKTYYLISNKFKNELFNEPLHSINKSFSM